MKRIALLILCLLIVVMTVPAFAQSRRSENSRSSFSRDHRRAPTPSYHHSHSSRNDAGIFIGGTILGIVLDEIISDRREPQVIVQHPQPPTVVYVVDPEQERIRAEAQERARILEEIRLQEIERARQEAIEAARVRAIEREQEREEARIRAKLLELQRLREREAKLIQELETSRDRR